MIRPNEFLLWERARIKFSDILFPLKRFLLETNIGRLSRHVHIPVSKTKELLN